MYNIGNPNPIYHLRVPVNLSSCECILRGPRPDLYVIEKERRTEYCSIKIYDFLCRNNLPLLNLEDKNM